MKNCNAMGLFDYLEKSLAWMSHAPRMLNKLAPP